MKQTKKRKADASVESIVRRPDVLLDIETINEHWSKEPQAWHPITKGLSRDFSCSECGKRGVDITSGICRTCWENENG